MAAGLNQHTCILVCTITYMLAYICTGEPKDSTWILSNPNNSRKSKRTIKLKKLYLINYDKDNRVQWKLQNKTTLSDMSKVARFHYFIELAGINPQSGV